MASEEMMILAELRADIRKLSKERQADFNDALTAAIDLQAAHGDLGVIAMQIQLLEHTVAVQMAEQRKGSEH